MFVINNQLNFHQFGQFLIVYPSNTNPALLNSGEGSVGGGAMGGGGGACEPNDPSGRFLVISVLGRMKPLGLRLHSPVHLRVTPGI